jgi:hypothetical protein
MKGLMTGCVILRDWSLEVKWDRCRVQCGLGGPELGRCSQMAMRRARSSRQALRRPDTPHPVRPVMTRFR